MKGVNSMNEFSTAGITVKYAVETTSGERPTTGYSTIQGIKSTPDFNPEPSTLEVTDLSDTEWKRYIPGLKDVGGALAFSANLTTAFKTAWASLVEQAETAKKSDKSVWFEIAIPDFESFYFAGMPSELGVSAFETDQVAEIDAYVTPNKLLGWAEASN